MVKEDRVVCIDPGHGLGNKAAGVYDPGAVGSGVHEADLALAQGLTLKYVLAQAGIKCVMTRDEKSDVTPVGDRAKKAKKAGATVYVSIHMNSGAPGATGTEIIVRDAEDRELAGHVLPKLIGAIGLKNRGVKDEASTHVGRLAVLSFDGPAILIEVAFISNPKDVRQSTGRDKRIAIAEAIRDGILEYWAA